MHQVHGKTMGVIHLRYVCDFLAVLFILDKATIALDYLIVM